ncbi:MULTISPECIES: UDP-N-acetylmuramoyl-tripeptide--D-alanyl-D-alanine ligase [Priestia]|uniref:UDP-N-acetylmuramoyl-tripeptide--D-alanyl-D- alanine ligase n=1 Tax=Priestia TaxID=2800373 RepID=UPI0005EC7CFC|nr:MULTISPECIES: UDP-N-acetylmuramoyl-tripeptide--D-alanyl-D-alanine ligase [Priestia]KJL02455.1 UDP-N-acetylmuramoyl-tripeptide--D-alanyl-D-alanine ligase [Priestia aryabhattai B8W22]MBX4164243.1 UDP-N-acetylmuramoyl-tripeptide--D-alanyl-D-alanine ligase [Priestia megaterium]MED3897580.1 UDP-N-acetylmuramoyl-tripeptide--D-alanyl-D-alanine ligase [Priestia aryabhattai]
MIKRTLKQLAAMIPGSVFHSGNKAAGIEGVSIDTRTIQQGNLYIPIKGERFNGHTFVDKATENGAVATLWNKDEENPPTDISVILVDDTLEALQQLAKSYRHELDIKVVGITGSNGKTTAKDMVKAVLDTTYCVLKTDGNFNNHIGMPLTILRLDETHDIAVLEMGMSSRGEIEFLSNLAEPDVAIITNIGESHLQDLGSRDGIAEAKLEITSGLAPTGQLVYNGDEPLLTSRVVNPLFETVTFGSSEQNDLYPSAISAEELGTTFTVSRETTYSFFIPVLGKHNVHNALSAIAVGHYFGLDNETIAKGLKELKLTNMRMELVKRTDGLTFINDAYNASPTSVKAAITLMHDLEGYKQKILVLGDMLELGDQEKEFHKEVGEFIQAEKIDYVLTYGPLSVEIEQGAKNNFAEDKVMHFEEKDELVKKLTAITTREDVVLVKASRGMKLEEVISKMMYKLS